MLMVLVGSVWGVLPPVSSLPLGGARLRRLTGVLGAHDSQRFIDEDLGGHASGAGSAHHRDAYLLALEECGGGKLRGQLSTQELAMSSCLLGCRTSQQMDPQLGLLGVLDSPP